MAFRKTAPFHVGGLGPFFVPLDTGAMP